MLTMIETICQHLDTQQETKNLQESVHEALRKTIILGDIPPGTRINEKVLARELNISRTPVRHALQTLQKEKLVSHEPRVGMIVQGISRRDAKEIFKIRLALETLITIEAMEHMSEDALDDLDDLIAHGFEMHEAGNLPAVIQNFTDFNEFIYQASNMKRLPEIISQLTTYLSYFRNISVTADSRRLTALQEHQMIATTMRKKNPMTIQLLVEEHLNKSRDFVLEEMERLGID